MALILVVDDDADNRSEFSRILSRDGHTCHLARCVSDVGRQTIENQYDLVLMDIGLPMELHGPRNLHGGIEAIKILRLDPTTKDVPIVAVTAHGMESDRHAIMQSGANDIVEKGREFMARRLREAISRYVLSASDATKAALSEESPVANRNQESPAANRDVVSAKMTSPEPLTASKIQDHFSLPSSTTPQASATEGLLDDRIRIRSPKQEVLGSTNDFSVRSGSSSHDPLLEICQHLKAAIDNTDSFIAMIEEMDRDLEQRAIAERLQHALRRALEFLKNGFSKEADVSLQHWVRNKLIGPKLRLEDLVACEREFVAPLAERISPICEHLQCAMTAADRLEGNDPTSEQMSFASPDTTASTTSWEDKLLSGRVLIVDDNADAREDLYRKVQQLRHYCFQCGSGREALELLKKIPFDVCLVDMHMPDMDGIQLIQAIRSNPSTHKLPIIMVSGSSKGQSNTAARAIEMGADDYLDKPANEAFLRARIRSCIRQTSARREELAKFLPQDVLESAMTNDDLLQRPKVAHVSVMVCDIRGFSRISEILDPVATIEWISDVMNQLSNVVLGMGGTIVDYVGDEIMAMWGAPTEVADHEAIACRCAIRIQETVEQLSVKWIPKLGEPLRIGIGINSGLAICGNTGSQQRLKYGPLGSTVNLASRVQGTTKYLHSPILITGTTAKNVPKELKGRRLRNVRVHNMSHPVQLIEVQVQDDERKQRLNSAYIEALELYEIRELDDAIKLLAGIIVEFPQDGPSMLLLMHALQAKLSGTFDPIWTMSGK